MKKHTALKQNTKNDTRIEFRRDIKALTLLADSLPLLLAIYSTVETVYPPEGVIHPTTNRLDTGS